MFGKIKIAALSALIAMGSLAAAPTTASAGSVDIDVYFGGGYGPIGWGGGHGGGWGGGYGNKCQPWKAENKARNMGLKHTYIASVGPNQIVVKGKKWGHNRTVVFGRHASCPIKASW